MITQIISINTIGFVIHQWDRRNHHYANLGDERKWI